jgi:hypothetical protein
MKTPRERAEELANKVRREEMINSDIDGFADVLESLLEEIDAARAMRDELESLHDTNSDFFEGRVDIKIIDVFDQIRKRNEGTK